MFFQRAKLLAVFVLLMAGTCLLPVANALAAPPAIETLLKTGKCPKCDLSGADLEGANLKKADLEGANLKGANLKGADLEGANLKGADLRQADLGGARLKGAFCRLTNFDGAVMPDGKSFSITNNPKKYGCRR